MRNAILWHLVFWGTIIGAKLTEMSLDQYGWACAIVLYLVVLIVAITRESHESKAFIGLELEKIASEERKFQAGLVLESERTANELELGKLQTELLEQQGEEEPERDLHIVGFEHSEPNTYPDDVIIPPDLTP